MSVEVLDFIKDPVLTPERRALLSEYFKLRPTGKDLAFEDTTIPEISIDARAAETLIETMKSEGLTSQNYDILKNVVIDNGELNMTIDDPDMAIVALQMLMDNGLSTEIDEACKAFLTSEEGEDVDISFMEKLIDFVCEQNIGIMAVGLELIKYIDGQLS